MSDDKGYKAMRPRTITIRQFIDEGWMANILNGICKVFCDGYEVVSEPVFSRFVQMQDDNLYQFEAIRNGQRTLSLPYPSQRTMIIEWIDR